MSRQKMNNNKSDTFHNQGPVDANAWVLTTKRVGDHVAGWKVDHVFTQKIRKIDRGERCMLTSFCYPPGAKLVKARLLRE